MKIEQPDKVFHAAAGALIYLWLCWGLIVIGKQSLMIATAGALFIATAIAWAKERMDKARPQEHTWDGWDAYATTIGAVVMHVVLSSVLLMLRVEVAIRCL